LNNPKPKETSSIISPPYDRIFATLQKLLNMPIRHGAVELKIIYRDGIAIRYEIRREESHLID
jgi:hypothetical protein